MVSKQHGQKWVFIWLKYNEILKWNEIFMLVVFIKKLVAHSSNLYNHVRCTCLLLYSFFFILCQITYTLNSHFSTFTRLLTQISNQPTTWQQLNTFRHKCPVLKRLWKLPLTCRCSAGVRTKWKMVMHRCNICHHWLHKEAQNALDYVRAFILKLKLK